MDFSQDKKYPEENPDEHKVQNTRLLKSTAVKSRCSVIGKKHRRSRSSRSRWEVPSSRSELKELISKTRQDLPLWKSCTVPACNVQANDVVTQALNDRLLKAANSNEAENVAMLVKMKANPNVIDDIGFSALMWSAHTRGVECVKTLLNYRANPTMSTALGWTALMDAAQQGNEEIMQILLDAKSRVNETSSEFGRTALHEAAFVNCPGNIRRLIDAGADHRVDSSGDTPLIIASSGGLLGNVKVMVEHEGPSMLNSRSIIAGVLRHFYPELSVWVADLIGEMAVPPCELELENDDGHSALYVALNYRHKDVATYLENAMKGIRLVLRGVMV